MCDSPEMEANIKNKHIYIHTYTLFCEVHVFATKQKEHHPILNNSE